MHNFLRKSIVIISAGLFLLFLYTCKTTSSTGSDDYVGDTMNMELFFPENRDAVIYLESSENMFLVESIINSFMLKGSAEKTIKNSRNIFIATGFDRLDGFDIILEGDYSRFTMELGLFFSFDWKKVHSGDHEIWESSDGIKLSFIDSGYIAISTSELSDILDSLSKYNIETPEDSLLVLLPALDKETVKKLSSGFIKGGVESLSLALNAESENYTLNASIGVTEGKAKAFSRLINIFLKLAFSGSLDPNIVKAGNEFKIEAENSTVLISNIVLNQKKVVELLNNILVIKGEADK